MILRGLRPKLSWLCLAALCLAVVSAIAAQPDAAPEQEPPGKFDFYLMSFTIAPSFCALSARYAEKQECRAGTDAAYRAMPLTVHGLWPNRERVSVNLQPQYCAGPRLDSLSPALRGKLTQVMPGVADGLDRYEWRRHGVCTGLTAEAYFSAVVRLAEQADATIGAVLRDGGMLGHEVKVDDLLAAVAAKDASLAAAMIVSCRFPREDGSGPSRAYVQEIRLVLSKDFSPEPAGRVGFGQNSGCPGKAGFLPAGFAGR
jgi:ribonuclease T2